MARPPSSRTHDHDRFAPAILNDIRFGIDPRILEENQIHLALPRAADYDDGRWRILASGAVNSRPNPQFP